jgi:hypothetical protein
LRQRQETQSGARRIDGQQRAFVQLKRRLLQSGDNRGADSFRADILGSDLHNARLAAVRRRQNRTEIQIMRENDVSVGAREGQNGRVRRVRGAEA